MVVVVYLKVTEPLTKITVILVILMHNKRILGWGMRDFFRFIEEINKSIQLFKRNWDMYRDKTLVKNPWSHKLEPSIQSNPILDESNFML